MSKPDFAFPDDSFFSLSLVMSGDGVPSTLAGGTGTGVSLFQLDDGALQSEAASQARQEEEQEKEEEQRVQQEVKKVSNVKSII